MEAILEAVDRGRIRKVRPRVVVSNRPDAPGLKLAQQKFGVPTHILNSSDKSRSFEHELVEVLDKYGMQPYTSIICLAGFMKVLSPYLVERYRMRIMNIHPSLLPSFPGLYAQRQALEYGAKVSGCTVHFVDEGVDTGPILLQRAVRIFDTDNEDSLTRRILEVEHTLYPEAIRLVAEGRLKIIGRRIMIMAKDHQQK